MSPQSLPIELAKVKTEAVQEELEVAGAELHLANTAIAQTLPPAQKQGDVKKALDQSQTVEDKVNHAAEELAHVTELLEREVAQRHRLEARLAGR
jgi:hypothetical protein